MSEEQPTIRELLVEISEGRGAYSPARSTLALPPAKDLERVKTILESVYDKGFNDSKESFESERLYSVDLSEEIKAIDQALRPAPGGGIG